LIYIIYPDLLGYELRPASPLRHEMLADVAYSRRFWHVRARSAFHPMGGGIADIPDRPLRATADMPAARAVPALA
jgi:hypothetical protein